MEIHCHCPTNNSLLCFECLTPLLPLPPLHSSPPPPPLRPPPHPLPRNSLLSASCVCVISLFSLMCVMETNSDKSREPGRLYSQRQEGEGKGEGKGGGGREGRGGREKLTTCSQNMTTQNHSMAFLTATTATANLVCPQSPSLPSPPPPPPHPHPHSKFTTSTTQLTHSTLTLTSQSPPTRAGQGRRCPRSTNDHNKHKLGASVDPGISGPPGPSGRPGRFHLCPKAVG